MVRFPCHTSKESLLHKTKSPNFLCFISSVQFKGSIQVKHHHVRQVLHIFLGRKQGIAPAELVWKSSLCLCQTDFSQLNTGMSHIKIIKAQHQSTTSSSANFCTENSSEPRPLVALDSAGATAAAAPRCAESLHLPPRCPCSEQRQRIIWHQRSS